GGGGLGRGIWRDTGGTGERQAAAAGGDRSGGGHLGRAGLRGRAAQLPQEPGAVGAHRDVRARGLAAPARQHAVPAGLREQRRGPVPQDTVPDLLCGLRLRRGVRVRVRPPRLRRATGRRVRRHRRGARRLPGPVPEGQGVEPGAVPVLYPAAHPRVGRARPVVRAAVGVLVRLRLRWRRRGLRGARLRLPGRPAGRPGRARVEFPAGRERLSVSVPPVAEHTGAEHAGLFDGVFSRGAAGTGSRAWLRAMLDTEAALARALERAGLAPAGAGAAVTPAAAAAPVDPRPLGPRAAPARDPGPPPVAPPRQAAPPGAAAPRPPG